MKTYVTRLKRGSDLRNSIEEFAKEHKIDAGCIITCVGCLESANIRVGVNGSKQVIKSLKEPLEIDSLVGTISKDGVHLHITLSDKDGRCMGGHVKEGCIIDTTAEIVMGKIENYKFSRKFDNETGYDELVAEEIDSQ